MSDSEYRPEVLRRVRRSAASGKLYIEGHGVREGKRFVSMGIWEETLGYWRGEYGSHSKGAEACTLYERSVRSAAEGALGRFFSESEMAKMSSLLGGLEIARAESYDAELLSGRLGALGCLDMQLMGRVRMLGVAETEAVYRRCGCKIV